MKTRDMNPKLLIGIGASLVVIIVVIIGTLLGGGNQNEDGTNSTTPIGDTQIEQDGMSGLMLDTDKVVEAGEATSIEALVSSGIVDEERIGYRQSLLAESETYQASDRSFSKEVGMLIEVYGSLEALLYDEDGLTALKAVFYSYESDEVMLATYDDILLYNQIYEFLNMLASDEDYPHQEAAEAIIQDMEDSSEDTIEQMAYVNETHIKGQKTEDGLVVLRWQQGSEWIPEYGYNLYRIVDGDISKVASEIGSIASIMDEGDDYVKELVATSLIDTKKAEAVGFDTATELKNFLASGLDSKPSAINVMNGYNAFNHNRAVAYSAIEPSTYAQNELGMQTVIAGSEAIRDFNESMLMDIAFDQKTVEEALQEKLAEDELKKIIDSRALIAAGSDVDIDLALAAGFAYKDDISNVDGSYITYVLEPVYTVDDQKSSDAILNHINNYNLGFDFDDDVEQLRQALENNPEDDVIAYTTIVPIETFNPLKAPIEINGYGVNNAVTMRWAIEEDGYTENITSGYNVYRKLGEETDFTKINVEPVLIQYATQTIAGKEVNVQSSFFYMDEAVKNKDYVEYKIESIDLFGRTSGLSESTLVINEVVKTLPPDVPGIEKPILIRDSEDMAILGQLKYQFALSTVNNMNEVKDVEDRIILPLSNNQSDVVILNVYRSEAYGKDGFSEPELITSLNGYQKPVTVVTLSGDKIGLGKEVYLPGMYYEDKDIEKGHYYKYWISAVDEWGNESSWSYGMSIGYPKETYNDMVTNVASNVVEEVRLDHSEALAGFVMDRYNTTNQIENLRDTLFSGIATVDFDYGYDINLSNLNLNGNDNMLQSTVDANSYFGQSMTVTSMLAKAELPDVISYEFMNLPDVNQVHAMIGYSYNELEEDGSAKVLWPAYPDDDFGGYGVYRGIVKDTTIEALNQMSKGEVIEAIQTCELVSEQMENQLIDVPGSIESSDMVVYLIALLPKEGDKVSSYSHLNDLQDAHAIGCWVRLQWRKPEDAYQVGGYRIYKAYLEELRLMEIEDIDPSTISYDSLDWTLVEDNIDYRFYFESVDQMREQHVAYKIVPVSLWGVEGDPLYEYIRVPALIPPATPEVLEPYSKPGMIEVRFNTVEDASHYTVYKTKVRKVSRLDITQFLSNNQMNNFFGIEASRAAFMNHADLELNHYAINNAIDFGREISINGVSPAYDFVTVADSASMVNYTNVMPIDPYLESVTALPSSTMNSINNFIENEYGILALSAYANLTQDKAKTIEWEKVTDISSKDVQVGLGETVTVEDKDVDFMYKYYYTVSASNIDLESVKAEPVEAECKKYEALNPPTNLEVESGVVSGTGKWGNALTWDHATETGFGQEEVINDLLVGYIVYRKSSADGQYYQVSNVIKDNEFVDYTAYAYQTYYYQVEAIDIAGLISEPSISVTTSNVLLDTLNMAKTGILGVLPDNLTILNPVVTMIVTDDMATSGQGGLKSEATSMLGNMPETELEDFALKLLHDDTISDDMKEVVFDVLVDDYRIDMNEFIYEKKVNNNLNLNTNLYVMEPILTIPTLPSSEEKDEKEENKETNSNTLITPNLNINTDVTLDLNDLAIKDIDKELLKPLTTKTDFSMVLIDSQFKRLQDSQTAIQGVEPEMAYYDIEGGWIGAGLQSINEAGGITTYVEEQLTLNQAYEKIKSQGTIDFSGYTIEGIPESAVYKDKITGTVLKGTGYLYVGSNKMKIPVVFKIDYKRDSWGYGALDYMDLAMFPYRDTSTGLTLTSLGAVVDPNQPTNIQVSGYLTQPDGSYLLPDMHMIYFEDAMLSLDGSISIYDGAFPAFHFDDYLVYGYSSLFVNLDYMADYSINASTMVSNSRYPITLMSGHVDTSFGYPTMDNKGLEFGFKSLGIMPSMGLFGDITTGGETVTRLIVPKGISVKLSYATLRLNGDGTDENYTSMKGEVMLPYLRLAEDAQIPNFYDNYDSDPRRYFENAYGDEVVEDHIIYLFEQVKDGGILVIGAEDDERTYELSTIPFELYSEDIDNGFILEHVTLDRTFVGNYDIFGSKYMTGNYEETIEDWENFVLAIEGSLVIESDDATVDLSIVEQGTTARQDRWYSENDWKGILFDEARISISAYKLQLKDENGSSEIGFQLESQELIYDRNGFIYQNFMESLENTAIVLGPHYGGFENAFLESGSAEIYNGEIKETYIGTVMIPALLNEKIGFTMQSDKETISSCTVAPKTVVLGPNITMEIYGGYFDRQGAHLEGALLLPELTDEKMSFAELVLPNNQTLMTTLRDNLGEGENIEYGTAMFTKPFIVNFNGFDMEMAYFDLYSVSEVNRTVQDALGDDMTIGSVDMKLYGSTALTDNMEHKSSEKNAQIYIEDIHGAGDFDYSRCKVQVKVPSGNGYITGEVTASPNGDMPDLTSDINGAMNAASEGSREVLELMGDAEAVLQYINSKIDDINTLKTTIDNTYAGIGNIMSNITIDVSTVTDIEQFRVDVKNMFRADIDRLNVQIESYNDLVVELEMLTADMYQLPDDFDSGLYVKLPPIDKGQFMVAIDAMVDELRRAILEDGLAGIDALTAYVTDIGADVVDDFELDIPSMAFDFGGFELNNQLSAFQEGIDEMEKLIAESGEAVGAFQDAIGDLAADNIVQFIVTGDEAFEMVMDESANFLNGTNVQAVGNFGYRIPTPGTDEEAMEFYAFGIGYVDTPNSPDSTLNLGVIELANLVSVTGYNMILPYSKSEGYTVGHGMDLLDSVKDLKIDLDNNGESFFIAAGDAYILSSRQRHICALKEMRFIKESDGSFEITGQLMGPSQIQMIAIPSANNSVEPYGGARILYNARNSSYKLSTLVNNIPIDPAGMFKVGGTIGLEWDDNSFMLKMGYPEDMKLTIADLVDGKFGMIAGVNPYSENLIFMMKMGVELDKSFDVGIVYADVGVHFDSQIGYGIWNFYDDEKEFPWYKDGKVFEGIGANTRLYGYMRGGIDIGKRYNIISASIDASASILNPREDIEYVWIVADNDYDVRRSGIADKNDWILHADLRVKYSIGFWLVSYSDDFYYDLETTI